MKILLGREGAGYGRALTVLPDDVFITSYPRSGNTWVRFLVANMIFTTGMTNFLNIDNRIPDIYKFSDAHLLKFSKPRILKSHEYFDPRYPKILYIVRDVRSVIVSYYYYHVRIGVIGLDFPYYEYTKLFISGALDNFGTWEENVLSWIRILRQNERRFCLLKYEDLRKNCLKAMTTMNSFLGLNCSEELLKHAIEMSSFKKMSSLESEAGSNWKGSVEVKNKPIKFVRSGDSEEWKRILDDKSLSLINQNYSDLLLELGYQV
ncbi:sulfotransferase domain-containing protein [Thermodesulfobacteriota bacterium]